MMSGLDRSAVSRSNLRSTSSSLSIIGLGGGCAPLSGHRQGRTGSRNSVDFRAGSVKKGRFAAASANAAHFRLYGVPEDACPEGKPQQEEAVQSRFHEE